MKLTSHMLEMDVITLQMPLMQGAAIMGMTFHLVCPKELNPTDELLNRCNDIADKNGGVNPYN